MENINNKQNLEKLHLPPVGTAAPLFSLAATDGTTVELDSHAKPVALIFMRHLA
jgi:hypothetical protein